MRYLIILAAFIFACEACDPFNTKVVIINESVNTIFIYTSKDSTFSNEYDEQHIDVNDQYKPNLGKVSKKSWEDYINSCQDSTYWIFISTQKNFQIYRRIGYKVRELDSMNWIVVIKDS